jgi:hypothetical protein
VVRSSMRGPVLPHIQSSVSQAAPRRVDAEVVADRGAVITLLPVLGRLVTRVVELAAASASAEGVAASVVVVVRRRRLELAARLCLASVWVLLV